MTGVCVCVCHTVSEVAVAHGLSDLRQGASSGPQLHHAQAQRHAQGGEDDVVVSPRGLQLVVQSDRELGGHILGNVRCPTTRPPQQEQRQESKRKHHLNKGALRGERERDRESEKERERERERESESESEKEREREGHRKRVCYLG